MNKKAYRVLLLAVVLCAAGGVLLKKNYTGYEIFEEAVTSQVEEDYIHWVDFNVSYEALCAAYEADLQLHEALNGAQQDKKDQSAAPESSAIATGNKTSENTVTWIDFLAITAAKSGGSFGQGEVTDIKELAEKLKQGQTTLEAETADLKYYDYYKEAYSAVLDQYVGEYTFLDTDENGNTTETKGYGIKAFSPIAKGFPYSDYDDFGVSRSYGYKRQHLGHDMMGQVGTPIIAVESGYVECLGWNQYGGWRIGVRSFDQKRYYYYAHLRQNYPYAEGLEEGDVVSAGQVIGYMGHTGYSATENVNNIDETHLHFGIQLIFDESQKEGNNEIWIDCYALVRFLYRNQSQAVKVGDTREWVSLRTLKQTDGIENGTY